MNNKLLILLFPVLLAGCSSPKFSAEPISSENQSNEITIVKDNETRDVFLQTMKEWCLDTGHQCEVAADDTTPKAEDLTLIYSSRWSWDFRTFIADAKIKAYKNNRKVGEVEFKAPNGLNTNKFGDDSKRIESMMSILFNQETIDAAQDKISDGSI
ncbi:Sbal_3080 family lipoprotein [Aliivibrio sp. S2TY2]|uniref:Lipoprotein n=1 Tax=Aliivibrio sifiae TaxID=566293 RepID=A0A2S7X2T7_9GAMM|nr:MULTISPECIES: Sbal_3080 family lipoprotein [Aliivibrio]MDD9177049.1 Sbal_3080 family lipoprotein [Aliivibrio sp. S3TY1]MDD9194112.1 Sbal_3080 family lipoprotein [Aliivibrio sp. S2TY2]PQJ84547.1 hypothetical protein BTO22_13595 [Aliivibrio sifiae]